MAHRQIFFGKGNILMYEIYDGDLLLFTVATRDEADEQKQMGFRIVRVAK